MNCIYCDREEGSDRFAINEDAYKVCSGCEKRIGLGETIADEMFSAKQLRSVMSQLGKKSWEARKGQNMSELAKKRWAKKNVK